RPAVPDAEPRRVADLRVRRDEGAVRMTTFAWLRRVLVLGLVLGVAALVIPDSAVKPTQMELVKLQRATGVDADNKDIIWVLAVGSDARPGEDMTRSRGDALQLIGMNVKTG